MIKKIYFEFIFLIFLGISTSLSLPPFNLYLINFFTFSFLFFFLIKKSGQQKSNFPFFVYGWFFGFGYFASNLYWISISLTFDQNFKFLIPLSLVLIPSFLSIFYGLICLFFKILKPKKNLSSFFLFSLIFGILEFTRGSILTGFPWNLIAYSFYNQLETINITSIIGTYGFNLLCISLFTSPALLILKDYKKGLLTVFLFLVIFISFNIYGSFYKDKFNKLPEKKLDYKIRVIGSNIGLERFYKKIDTGLVIQDLIDLSKPNLSEKTIFVWPEGIIPDTTIDELYFFKKIFSEKFNKNHFIILGINTFFEKNGSKSYFNSLAVYNNELELLDSYNKVKLVPFGEFLPLENILSKLGFKSLTNNYQSFSSGTQRNFIDISKQNFSLKILPLICYEIIYSGKLFNDYNFDLIVNISEDGWFGQSIGPKQHFSHSVFRAIESGKYVVRSSNNGIAAIINPTGIIEQSVKFGDSGYVDLKSTKKIQPTIFSKYGNKIFGLLILLYIFLIFSFNKIKDE